MIELDDDNPVNDEPTFDGPPDDASTVVQFLEALDPLLDDGTEMKYLKSLEAIDRLILAEEELKKKDAAEHYETIKAHEATRDRVLADLEAWRSGERGLFDDPDPE